MNFRLKGLADGLFFNRLTRPLSETLADYLVTRGRHRKERDAERQNVEALQRKAERLQAQCAELQASLAHERAEAEVQLKQLAGTIETLRRQRAELRRQRSEQANLVEALRGQRATLQEQRADQARIIEVLRSQREALQSARDETGGRLRETIERLRRQRDELQQQRSVQARNGRQATERLLALQRKMQGVEQHASLVSAIAGGAGLQAAAIDFVQAAFASDRMLSRAFCQSVLRDEATRDLGHLLSGIYYHLDGFPETALHHFRSFGAERAQAICPYAYFAALMKVDAIAGGRALVRFLDVSADLPPATKARLLHLFAKHRQLDGLRPRVQRLLACETDMERIAPEERRQLEWMEERLADGQTPPRAEGAVSIAVMDYKLLDRWRTSSNLGDYVQTLAVLANLCRFADIAIDEGDALGRFAAALQQAVHPDRRLPGPAAKIAIVPLDRDFASGRNYPKKTWLIANGWFMHRNFRGDFDFPFPDHISPIFVSVHINNPDILTPQTVAYLKRHEPIGCRDWNTVYGLRDFNIASFFSGCLTTTLGQVFTPPRALDGDRLAVVEAALEPDDYPGLNRTSFVQYGDEVRDRSLVENLSVARAMLEDYLDCAHVVTSRLHCYLPCRALGLPVDFRPRNRADVRFEGLLDLDAEALRRMGADLEAKLESVFRLIIEGADETIVRRHWAEICAADVAAAERYAAQVDPLPQPSFDVAQVCRTVRAGVHELAATQLQASAAGAKAGGAVAPSNEVHVAFALDPNMASMLPPVLASICAHTGASVTVHLLSRGLPPAYVEELHGFFPQLRIRQYDFSGIDYGDMLHLLPHTTISTVDRLLLPELLGALDKVVYLDVDLLVQADIADLYGIDLGDAPLAAKLTRFEYSKSGTRMVTRASLALDAQRACDLRRRLHKEGSLAFPAFNAGVVLMNLAQMRTDAFSQRHLPLIERYALNDQDALNVYARSGIVVLDESWNYVPAQDYCERPKIIHWAGQMKPWGELYVMDREKFAAYAERYRLRGNYEAGMPWAAAAVQAAPAVGDAGPG